MRRAIGLAATIALLGTSFLIGPGSVQARDERLRFNKPVALTSFAPARTAVSAVYSLRRGEDPSDHEWAGEPSVEVDRDGTIYASGVCCVVAASPVWVSRDGGKSFEELETPGHVREWGTGAEGDIAIDDQERMYFIDTWVPSLWLTRWSEGGESWDYTTHTAGVVPGLNDRPWIAWSKEALWLYVNYGFYVQVYYSTDGGLTWLTEGPVNWERDGTGGFFPGHFAADRKTGAVWVGGPVPIDDDLHDEGIGVAVSTDMSESWTRALVTKPQRDGGISPIFTGIMAVDDAGNGYTTWSSWDKRGCSVYYASSTNKGRTWSDSVKVSSGPGCATFPWIDAAGDGKVAIVWYQTPTVEYTEPQCRIKSGNCTAFQDTVPEDARWYLHAAAIPNALSNRPAVISARVPTPTPVMEGPLGRELWDYFQVDLGPDGRMNIAYSVKWKDSAPQTWFVSNKTGPRLR